MKTNTPAARSEWTENDRRLRVSIWDRSHDNAIKFEPFITILAPGFDHPRHPGHGANVECLRILSNGMHACKFWQPMLSPSGKPVMNIIITEAQYRAATAYIAEQTAKLTAAKLAEIEARPEIVIEWGGGTGDDFMGERAARGQLIERELRAAGISWTTDWENFYPHSATVNRPQWREMETRIAAALAERGAAIERHMNGAVGPSTVQLWEPCERCGAEPSYVTPSGKHLCESCQ